MTRNNVVRLPTARIDEFNLEDETVRGIVAMYAALSYNVYGVMPHAIEEPLDEILFAIYAQRYSSLLAYGAIDHSPYCELLLRPGRADFCDALRAQDSDAMVTAFYICKADGLDEIEAEVQALRSYLKPLFPPSERPS